MPSPRSTLSLAALVALLAQPAHAADPLPYDQVAEAPSAYARESSMRVRMTYQGLQDVERAFLATERNATTHVQLRTPPTPGKPLPVFLSKKQSTVLRQLRETPKGAVLELRGRLRSFKSPAYDMESFLRSGGTTIEGQQLNRLHGYYKVDVKVDEPDPAGYLTHYVFDVRRFKVLEQAASAAETDGFQPIEPADLARAPAESAGLPLQFEMPYLGPLGAGESLPALPESLSAPRASWVEGELDTHSGELQVIRPPGPLSERFAIAYYSDWDVAEQLQSLVKGSPIQVRGTLQRAGEGWVFLLEAVDAAEREAPPRPPRRPPGPPGRRR